MTSHSDRERYCIECKQKRAIENQSHCGATCRKRAQRRREAAQLALPLAMHELGKIRDSIKRHERVPGFIADLKRLRGEIDDLLLLAGDIDTRERIAMLTQRKMHF